MQKLLKRIWYRIVYKRVDVLEDKCFNCSFKKYNNSSVCYDACTAFGKRCDYKIFVKRFKL